MKSATRYDLPRAAGQLTRFGFLGVAINLALYALYIVLTELTVAPVAAATICFVVGIPISLGIHRRFTFRAGAVAATRRVLFASGYLLGYLVQISGLYLLYRIAGLPHQAAQMIAMVAVALLLFMFQKFLVFRT